MQHPITSPINTISESISPIIINQRHYDPAIAIKIEKLLQDLQIAPGKDGVNFLHSLFAYPNLASRLIANGLTLTDILNQFSLQQILCMLNHHDSTGNKPFSALVELFIKHKIIGYQQNLNLFCECLKYVLRYCKIQNLLFLVPIHSLADLGQSQREVVLNTIAKSTEERLWIINLVYQFNILKMYFFYLQDVGNRVILLLQNPCNAETTKYILQKIITSIINCMPWRKNFTASQNFLALQPRPSIRQFTTMNGIQTMSGFPAHYHLEVKHRNIFENTAADSKLQSKKQLFKATDEEKHAFYQEILKQMVFFPNREHFKVKCYFMPDFMKDYDTPSPQNVAFRIKKVFTIIREIRTLGLKLADLNGCKPIKERFRDLYFGTNLEENLNKLYDDFLKHHPGIDAKIFTLPISAQGMNKIAISLGEFLSTNNLLNPANLQGTFLIKDWLTRNITHITKNEASIPIPAMPSASEYGLFRQTKQPKTNPLPASAFAIGPNS